MKRQSTPYAIAGAILAAGLLLAPTSAQAGSGLCAASRACIYDQQGFVALLQSRLGGNGSINVVSSINDLTSSWENKTTSNAAWWTEAFSSGTCRTMPSGTELGYVGGSANDRLTSWRTNGGC